MPRRGPSKVPIVIAMTALACFGAGLWLSATPAVFAVRLAEYLSSGWQGIGLPLDLASFLFLLGMLIAATLVVAYVRGLGSGQDPRTRRYRAR